jgi:predicted lipid-binding transport protein (Tim44 family)
MVAGFLAMRLYSVLGKRTGHEQPLPKPAEERLAKAPAPRTIDVTPEARDAPARTIETGAEGGLRAVIAADAGFDVARFLEGAKSAYRMILEAYWKGDTEALDWLVADDVRDAFGQAIAERKAAGHVLDNRLVAIAAVTRDGDGNVVAGSMTDAVDTHDIWTFARNLKSDDPNWKLVETDEV